MRYTTALLALFLTMLVMPSLARAAGEAPDAAGSVTIGIVDVKRVVAECAYKTYYQERIGELLKQKQREAADLEQKLKTAIDELENEKLLRGDEEKAEIDKEIDAKKREYLAFREETRKLIDARNRTFSDELEEKIKTIVENVAEERGIGLVINSMAILYKSGIIDLTDLVLAKLDEDYRNEHGDMPEKPETEGPETETGAGDMNGKSGTSDESDEE